MRTLISDFGVGLNQASNPRGVAVEGSGQILVIDSNAGSEGQGRLFRVNPTTGARSVAGNFSTGVTTQGLNPSGVTLEASGQILVIDPDVGTSGRGLLFRIDPASGARTRFPLTLKSKQRLTVTFDVPFDCATDPAKSTVQVDHDDFSYSATVDHSALDGGIIDDHPADDICPRLPLGVDPNPDGKLKDTGCVEDRTDVVVK